MLTIQETQEAFNKNVRATYLNVMPTRSVIKRDPKVRYEAKQYL